MLDERKRYIRELKTPGQRIRCHRRRIEKRVLDGEILKLEVKLIVKLARRYTTFIFP